MSLDTSRVEELFFAAQQIANPDEQRAWLETACAGDATLRSRVEALFSAAADASQFLNRPAVELAGETGAEVTQGFDGSSVQSGRVGPASRGSELSFLQPPSRADSLGRLGHYEVLDVVGQGGFGIVLRAFDEKLHRVVALKGLAPELAANGSARKRFIREARTAAAVKNEHVVSIYGVEENAQPPYLAMEMIDGKSLQEKIDQQGPFSLAEILRIGSQMAEGLAAAHKQGLVHRDIKPANILLENGVERVKITDFGLARAVDDASVTQSGTVAGTPMYMSPEQAEGLAIDHRSDLFSLGTVLYAMCTGHSAFRGSNTHAVLKRVIEASPRPIREVNQDVPDWLCAIIGKLHAKQPDDRFQTAKEVAELLGQHLAHLQQPSRMPLPAPVQVPVREDEQKEDEQKPDQVLAGSIAALSTVRTMIIHFAVISCVLALGVSFLGWHIRTVVRVGSVSFCLLAATCAVVALLAHRSNRAAWGRALQEAAISFGILAFAFGMVAFFEWLSPIPDPIPVPEVRPQVAANDDKERLQGVWQAVALSMNGEPAPAAMLSETSVAFEGNTMRFTMPGGRKDEGTFYLTETDSPKKLDVIGKDQKGRYGIYRFVADAGTKDSERLVICMGEEKERPTEFKSVKGMTRIVVTCKRAGAAAPDKWIDLLKLVDTKADVVSGPWKLENGGLVSGTEPDAKIALPIIPMGDYQLIVKFRRVEGEGGGPIICLPVGATSVQFATYHGSGVCALELVDGAYVSSPTNPTQRKAEPIRADKLYTADIRVSRKGDIATIRVEMDGERVIDFAGQPNRFSLHPAWSLGDDRRVGLRAWEAFRFESVQLKMLSGEAKMVRPAKEPEATGFVPLFNNKDLTGWKTHPDQPGDWKVVEGAIVGAKRSHLFSERADFENFHLRAKVKVEQGGNGGVLFRSQFGFDFDLEQFQVAGKMPLGYEMELASPSDKGAHQAGSVLRLSSPSRTELSTTSPIADDTWTPIEIIVRGNRIVTKVNGETAVDFIDRESPFQRGNIILQCHWASNVSYKDIEIKELPPAGFVSLFNGQDLQGWNSADITAWEVRDGALVGEGKEQSNLLLTERKDYADFHLRAEVKRSRNASSGLWFRYDPNHTWQAYEAKITSNSSQHQTGSLLLSRSREMVDVLASVADTPVKTNEWFTLEVIAQGKTLTVKVNGETTAIHRQAMFARGQIGLEPTLVGSQIHFRKVEIKEFASPAQNVGPEKNGTPKN